MDACRVMYDAHQRFAANAFGALAFILAVPQACAKPYASESGLRAYLGGERRVSQDQKQDDYLTKAKEADAMAEKARDGLTRDAWRKIAQNYRVLAGTDNESRGQAATGPRHQSS